MKREEKRREKKRPIKGGKSLNELHKQRVKDYRSRLFESKEVNSFRKGSEFYDQ